MNAPATLTYVLKPTDEWHADAGEFGLIWSGGLGRYKSRQYPERQIFAADGVTLLRDVLSEAAPPPDDPMDDVIVPLAEVAAGPNPMPAIATFTPDEELFARFSIGVARAGGAMFIGRLVECHVAGLLGAELPELGNSPWDLRVDGIHIEVKSAGFHQRFSLQKAHRNAVQVWVLVRKLPPDKQPDGHRQFDYYVLSSAEVERFGKLTIGESDLAGFDKVSADDLKGAVRAAATR